MCRRFGSLFFFFSNSYWLTSSFFSTYFTQLQNYHTNSRKCRQLWLNSEITQCKKTRFAISSLLLYRSFGEVNKNVPSFFFRIAFSARISFALNEFWWVFVELMPMISSKVFLEHLFRAIEIEYVLQLHYVLFTNVETLISFLVF